MGSPAKRTHLVPQRVIMVIMSMLSLTLAYMMRIALSYALTEMVKHSPSSGSKDACSPNVSDIFTSHGSKRKSMEQKYDWSQSTEGFIISSFYIGYAITHPIAGVFSNKYGAKLVLMVGTIIAGLGTILTPVCVDNGGITLLICIRIFVGFGEGAIFPGCAAMLSTWVPLRERSLGTTAVFSGAIFGSIVGSALSGIILDVIGWRNVFYIFGAISFIWCIILWFIFTDSPFDHPFISLAEREYLEKVLGDVQQNNKNRPPTPWMAMAKSGPFWAVVSGQVGHNWGIFITINALPKYMAEVLWLPIKENGLLLAAIYLILWIFAMLAGYVCDYLIRRNIISIKNARKIYTSISAFGPGSFLLIASYVGCDRVLVYIIFVFAMGTMGLFYSGFKANCIDISPNYAAVIMGIANGLGAITGIIGPLVVGFSVKENSLSSWRLMFWLTFSVLSLSAIVFDIFASGDVQWWNQPELHNQNEDEAQNATNEKAFEHD